MRLSHVARPKENNATRRSSHSLSHTTVARQTTRQTERLCHARALCVADLAPIARGSVALPDWKSQFAHTRFSQFSQPHGRSGQTRAATTFVWKARARIKTVAGLRRSSCASRPVYWSTETKTKKENPKMNHPNDPLSRAMKMPMKTLLDHVRRNLPKVPNSRWYALLDGGERRVGV